MAPGYANGKARQLDVAVECAFDSRDIVGESPVWSAEEDALYWVDIIGETVHRWRPSSGWHDRWQVEATIGSIGLREGGGLVLALRTGFHLFDTGSSRREFLCHPEPDIPTNRLNDGKVSPDGRFWAGTMDDRSQKDKVAALYRLDPDGRCCRMVDGLIVSNGLAWSPDGRTMYHSDSRGGAIWKHPYDLATGELGPRALFVTVDPAWGRPDGAAVDAEGCYWSCGVSAGRLNRFSPDGELLAWIEMPVSHPTMPCFGGSNLRTLYVTSLSDGLSPGVGARLPRNGSLFQLTPGVAGVPIGRFKG